MKLLRIHPNDNVAVALSPLRAGDSIQEGSLSLSVRQDIPQGHKIALRSIPTGAEVIKYGYSIGRACVPIIPGEWVHTHNLVTGLDAAVAPATQITPESPLRVPPPSFPGFRRANGNVGVRNEIWIIPTVGCVNDVAGKLAHIAAPYAAGKVDGVFAWPHPYGCSQLGDDQKNTRRILCGLIRHPNAGGVLVVGLGCENSNIDTLRALLGEFDHDRLAFLECQSSKGELAEGEILLRRLIDRASADHREPVRASELIVGLKCGGSDGLSGITANPLVGRVTDRLVSMGGSALLAEIPEMFGAEPVLFRRCADSSVAVRLPNLIEQFKDYFRSQGQAIYENPSPGNKAGGITTLEEKSLGCVQKGGSSPITDVLFYGEAAHAHGLSVLQTPGNDLVSATALAAAGAHLILFTTGRGTPFGAPVPTLKISTNHALAARKPLWIDYDAGGLADNDCWDEHVNTLWDLLLQIAGGTPTKAEQAGYRGISIWKNGVTL